MDENQTLQNTGIVSDAETTAAAQRLLENIENTLVEPTALDAPAPKSAPQETDLDQPAETPTMQEYTDESLPITPPVITTSETDALSLDNSNVESKSSQETTTYTLQPGDNLWDAAKAINGSDETDLRDMVHRIEVDPANSEALRAGLQPGQQLVVPVRIVGH